MIGLAVGMFYGRLTRDADIKRTNSGEDYATFSIAVNENVKDQNGQNIESASYYDCLSYAKGVFKYLKKGQSVIVSGRMKKRNYKGRDGSDKTSMSILVNDLVLVSASREEKKEADEFIEEEPRRVETSYKPKQVVSEGKAIVNAPTKKPATPDEFEEEFDF